MKAKKILFILVILGILFLLILAKNQKPITQGKISSIAYKSNLITINLENNEQEIVLFTNKILDLKENQTIKVYGTQETYKNKKQIIADKIIKLI